MQNSIDFTAPPHERATPERAITLFVSLYIVILSFFILLVSLAEFDNDKARDVTYNVRQTFSSTPAQQVDIYFPAGSEEAMIRRFMESMESEIQSIIPAEDMRVSHQERVLTIEMPASALFNRDDTSLRYDRQQFYQRLTETLATWRDDVTVNMSFIHGVTLADEQSGFDSTAPELIRTGNFARFMENRGVAPQHITIALTQKHPERLMLVFEFIPRDDAAQQTGGGGAR